MQNKLDLLRKIEVKEKTRQITGNKNKVEMIAKNGTMTKSWTMKNVRFLKKDQLSRTCCW